MKKIILAIALFAAVGANAQIEKYGQGLSDGFFSNEAYTEYRSEPWAQNMPIIPGQHGSDYDFATEAPLGSGLLLLAGMGIAYGRRKKIKK